MKSLKVALFGLLIATIGMLAATNAGAQTVRHFVWKTTVPAFVIGQPDANPLAVLTNYDINVPQPTCPNSTAKLCEVIISYSSGAPTNQGLVDAIRAKYIAQGNLFTDGQQFTATVNGVLVTFTIQLKP